MSEKWPGGFIQPVPPTPTGPLATGSATGVWTVDQMSYWLKQGLWPIAGNFLYIEDVFQTWLYTGTGSSQTITNNIDLSTKGGLVWIKGRSGITGHRLTDTARGATKSLASNNALAEATESTGLTAFGTTGFTIGADTDYNTNAATYVSWTFREQAKFFDIVTYSGDSVDNRQISHNLGSTPGCVIVRRLSGDNWFVYHRSLAANFGLRLDTTSAADSNTSTVKSVSSTTFTVGTDGMVNTTGSDYVAYLFAHDAGGFGNTGSDNVISCGSYTGNGQDETGGTINVGWEPQWLMIKRTDSSTNGGWHIIDNMRGIVTTVSSQSNDALLVANTNVAENLDGLGRLTATGFVASGSLTNTNGANYIYIAIRRGPMKTPTSGTSVFTPVIGTSSQSSPEYLAFNAGFPIDLSIIKDKANVGDNYAGTRLTGRQRSLIPNATSIETTDTINTYDNQSGLGFTTSYDVSTWIGWLFRRAPGFFDVVCYTGTGSATTFSHNLGVAPELMIVKARSSATDWTVYSSALGNNKYLVLNSTQASDTTSSRWNNTSPTASVFTVGTENVNFSSVTYINYLFATVAGVSKVGSYTGTGTTLQVNCGFTNGSRFVLIKRTDSTGDWYVWDSARGIVAGNDPYLLLNSTAAEVTNTDYIDTFSSGFEISSTAPAGINANGGTYIFLAIA